jgi:hypothetical protein
LVTNSKIFRERESVARERVNERAAGDKTVELAKSYFGIHERRGRRLGVQIERVVAGSFTDGRIPNPRDHRTLRSRSFHPGGDGVATMLGRPHHRAGVSVTGSPMLAVRGVASITAGSVAVSPTATSAKMYGVKGANSGVGGRTTCVIEIVVPRVIGSHASALPWQVGQKRRG